MKRIFLIDTMAFISILDEEDRLYEHSFPLFQKIQNKEIDAYASIMSLMECVYVLKRLKKSSEVINNLIHMLVSFENITYLPITSSLLIEAVEFMQRYKLSLSDAIIAATLLKVENAEFISSDSDFDSIPFIKRIPLEELKL